MLMLISLSPLLPISSSFKRSSVVGRRSSARRKPNGSTQADLAHARQLTRPALDQLGLLGLRAGAALAGHHAARRYDRRVPIRAVSADCAGSRGAAHRPAAWARPRRWTPAADDRAAA